MPKRSVVVLGAIVALLVAGLAYMTYAAAQKRAQQRQVKELVVDTTDKLRQVLVAKSAPDLVAPLDANLKAAKAPRDPELAEAAEHYILGAREIARRRADAERLSRRATASRHALASHMAHAGSRGAGWMNQAVVLKKRVEDDHFALGLSLKAMDELLYTLPEAEQRLAPHVGREVLIEASLRDSARKQAQDQLARANDDLERMRRLNLR
jgi:hypothetical protein